MKKRSILCIAMAAVMAASLVVPAFAAVDVAESDLAYAGDLNVMHFSTSEESEGNGGSDGFRTVLAAWNEAHPDINLVENVLANAEYKTQIATLAAAGDLPDVFLLQGMNTKQWAEQGLIMDLTDIIAASPYYDDYAQNYFTPFKVGDSIYGYPVLTGGTCTVVIYDKAMWQEAGFDSFPTTWEEVEEASAYFSEQGIDTIAFGNGGKWQANSCFLSTLGNRYTGPDWFQSLIDKSGAAFTDEAFVKALEETRYLFCDTDIFNDDYNAVTNEDAREYYISGDAAAFIGGNWDESYIWAALKDDDPEKFDNIGFAVLPQPADAEFAPDSQNIGLGYAVAFNSALADDPDKLAAAIDFAQEVTGPAFSSYVAENYALGGLTDAGEVDLSAFDQITADFYNWSYVDTEKCEIYDSYINSAVWDVVNTDLQTLMNGETTAEEVAANAQAAYEANY
ncbi:MAG: extracellular solute-binding protein [Blautia sp.]|nr:extracellular solute-binding protein [Blautia sp.]